MWRIIIKVEVEAEVKSKERPKQIFKKPRKKEILARSM
jgi:hypothetical protein